MAMKVEVKGNKLVIEIDMQKPEPSISGKTMVVAGTHGNVTTEAKYEGKPITVGLTAYYKPGK